MAAGVCLLGGARARVWDDMGGEGGTAGGWEYGRGRGQVGSVARSSNGSEIGEVGEVGLGGGGGVVGGQGACMQRGRRNIGWGET